MRRSTPRPVFDRKPTIIPNEDARHHVWGDVESGMVSDRVFLSTDALHVLEYQLGPGNQFRHSPMNATIFAADVIYIVLEGNLVITNPETGEVLPVGTGEAVLFHRDTWHHGYNPSLTESVRVLEFMSPPPSRGTASDYARKQPFLETSSFTDERWSNRWPSAKDEQHQSRTLHLVSPQEYLWSFAAESVHHLQGTLVDSEFLTAKRGTVNPGNFEEFRTIEHESAIYCTGGRLWIDIRDPETEAFTVATLDVGDVAYLPAGCESRMLVRDSVPAEYFLGTGKLMAESWMP